MPFQDKKGKKLSILFIEDDRVDEMAFRRFVDGGGVDYDYTVSRSIADAMDKLKAEQYDAVITDYHLADGTALELFGVVKSTPVIVTTGTSNQEIAVGAMKAGAADYLIKDFEHNHLKVLPVTVENAIKHKRDEGLFNMLSHAMRSINDSVYITDLSDNVIFVNKAFCEAYGYEEDEIIGKPRNVLWSKSTDDEKARELLDKTLKAGCSMEVTHRHKSGAELAVSLSRSSIKNEYGEEVAIAAVSRDITERKRLEEKLRALSFLDELTGIANRRSYEKFIEAEWRRATRERTSLSVILIDIDYFKLYNDTYGHQAGDECLRLVASAIDKVAKRQGDMVARYGGEEFIVVLPGTDASGVGILAEAMREKVSSLEIAHKSSEVGPFVTISLGVASMLPVPGTEPSTLVAAADIELYRAKQFGRNRIETCSLIK